MKCINNSLCMRIECSVCCSAMFYSRITISFILLTFFYCLTWITVWEFEYRFTRNTHDPMIQKFKFWARFGLQNGREHYKTLIFQTSSTMWTIFVQKWNKSWEKKQQNKKHHHLQWSKVTHTYKLKFMKNRWIASCKCIPDKVLDKDESPTQCDNRCTRKN